MNRKFLIGLGLVAMPLAAFVVLALVGGHLPRRAVSLLGVAPTGLAALVALCAAVLPVWQAYRSDVLQLLQSKG